MELPKQLEDSNFRFVKILRGTKRPLEESWQTTNNYFYEDFKDELNTTESYGIVCGFGNLFVVDFDSEELQKTILPLLPKTFGVKTGGKGLYHLYFKNTAGVPASFKVTEKKDGKIITLADIQGAGKQVIGAGSVHCDTGRTYEVAVDLPIAEYDINELKKLLSGYDLMGSSSISSGGSHHSELIPCKFHHDTKPSLAIYRDTNSFYCFGCHAYGSLEALNYKGELQTRSTKNGTLYYCNKERHTALPGESSEAEALNKITKGDGLNDRDAMTGEIDRICIDLPKEGRLISDYAVEVAEVLKDKNLLFFRRNSREVIEVGKIKDEKELSYTGFIPVRPSRFITLAEQFFTPGNIVRIGNVIDFNPKSMARDLTDTLLQSRILQEALPSIDRIFSVPIPIISEGKLTFPKRGYDRRFSSWLPYNAPAITEPDMTLEESKKIIDEIFREFCFQSEQDRVNAIAGLLTPFLRGLYLRFNARTPAFFYIANRERAGKDYLAGITGLVYEGVALEEPPICSSETRGNSDDELRKKILSAFLAGRKRLHFSNNKGYLNSAVLEGIITNEAHSDRMLGKNEILEFNNELEFSLSGNVGIGFTPDLANRSIFVRLFLDIEDANARKFERPNLHQWVLENREKILSALYGLVRNWVDNGSKPGSVLFASFPEWARVCGGVMEAAGYDSPCKPDKDALAVGGDSETADMKRLFEICFEKRPEEPLTKITIRGLIQDEGLFSYLDLNDKSGQTKFGIKITKFTGRIFSGIRMSVVDKNVRAARQEFKFTKELAGKDKKEDSGGGWKW